jgi:hypothetical protein
MYQRGPTARFIPAQGVALGLVAKKECKGLKAVLLELDRAFSPHPLLAPIPGAMPQAGIARTFGPLNIPTQ